MSPSHTHHLQRTSLTDYTSLLNLNSLYILGYGWLFGMSVWVSLFGGVIAYKTLPRQQFGNLQFKTFPVYFLSSILLSSGLLAVWTFKHPDVTTHLTELEYAEVAQAYALLGVILCQGVNHFALGPMTSRMMFRRHRLEREQGKAYNESGVSSEMKALNKKFGALHGVSSLVNLVALVLLGFHGVWVGNAGIKGN